MPVVLPRRGAGIGILVLLGILTAFDSMSIDMYLPAFGAITESLKAGGGVLEMSLSVFLMGLAAGQAVSGPLVDSYGRRGPLLAGIVLFAGASALVALSTNTAVFMTGRFIQGIGGAAGLVIPRAIVSDLYDAKDSTKIFSLLIQIQSISPILAPPLGGLLLGAFGWQAIFWLLAGFGLVTLIASIVVIPETQPVAARTPLTLKGAFLGYWKLFRNARYLGMTIAAGLIMGTLFGYISGSSFVFMTHFKLSPSAYSLVFAAVSLGMIVVGQCNFFLCTRMSQERHLALGFIPHLVFITLFCAAVLLGFDSLETMAVLLFLAMSSLSLIFGGITAASMYSVPMEQAGTASALLGVMQYALGSLAGVVLGMFHDNTLLPFAATLTACSFLALFCWLVAGRLPKRDA